MSPLVSPGISSAPPSHLSINPALAVVSIAVLLALWALAHGIDSAWAHRLYALQGGRWVLRDQMQLFGFAQQMRGAHFLSHDVATLAVCWTVAVLLEVQRCHRLRSRLEEVVA